MRIVNENIKGLEDLGKKGVFVFGSNEKGIHGAGAALLAYQKFGAIIGQGFGFMGQSFAIPTKDWDIMKLDIRTIGFYVDGFRRFVDHSFGNSWEYHVTQIGCGLAGFSPAHIAPLFDWAVNKKNIFLPAVFLKELGHGDEIQVQPEGTGAGV